MTRKNKHLTLQIAELKEAVRRKFRQFKDGSVESERLLEKQYKPLIRELKNVEPKTEVKVEQLSTDEPMDYESDDDDYIGRPFKPEAISTPRAETSQLEEVVSSPSGFQTASKYIEEQFHNSLTKKYMTQFIKDVGGKNRTIDHDYGPRLGENGKTLLVGDKVVEFDTDGTIIINNTRYPPTEGIYELLFKRLPNSDVYTQDDLTTYKSILIATNAHKKGYDFHNQIRRDNNLKYRHVIKDLFPINKQGRGISWKSTKSRDIVHWDNPNELVDRLKLLVASAETGNTSHGNEILNIVEELHEAGYIRGAGNSRFKSLSQWV
ncbi:uncharacterized protein LOC129002724 [Macrosteles quadrilineatus]|uniref:uncharacterized protein LOC128982537 n=1 Tax=Macrosteles quadrilineatus TaxID=74068 RepID=UPI0023E314E8|nr:uncharacterized protein LOC128982537 [Macrosteles quadrilineatus]XP_054259692.1 uncharacterized protein LOC128984399 [Macrosteles quadrilineatus]XP_054276130.1 uncharacterized protein LOC128995213 [Macrosteles quadrilineatus]XP_054283565.1 uncharacterized protein LOC129000628 [Macrosteles quadrilineatus]XP_054286718.1 uncharacterized protein LOC129002724 [Macrosteles quadrilineatus]